jgi:hypothetical protein
MHRDSGRIPFVEPNLPDLVEQGPIANLQQLGRLGTVPAGSLQDPVDRLPLGRARRLSGDVLERVDWRGALSV